MGAAPEKSVTVRLAAEGDRAAAMALLTPGTPRGRISLALLRAGQGLLWVAVECAVDREEFVGLLLATAQVDPDGEALVGYIQELLVHPAYRRLGVAMHLLDAAERYFLVEQGFDTVALATSPDNEAALRLYRSRGYTIHVVHLSKHRAPTQE
jgi:ribosomal protein S18 acetylase RimI-like enzyme